MTKSPTPGKWATPLAVIATLLAIFFAVAYFVDRPEPIPVKKQAVPLPDLLSFALDVELSKDGSQTDTARQLKILKILNLLNKSTLVIDRGVSEDSRVEVNGKWYCLCDGINVNSLTFNQKSNLPSAADAAPREENPGCCYCGPKSLKSSSKSQDPGTGGHPLLDAENIFLFENDGIIEDPSLSFTDSTQTVIGESEIIPLPGNEDQFFLLGIPITAPEYVGPSNLHINAVLDGEEVDFTISGVMDKKNWMGLRQLIE